MVRNYSAKSLIDHFSGLRDPRQGWKVVYPLLEITLLDPMCDAGGRGHVRRCPPLVGVRRSTLYAPRLMLAFNRNILSQDTLNNVINALDPAMDSNCFGSCVEILREDEPDIVTLCGKVSRRARRGDVYLLHVVSVWATQQRLALGQQAVDQVQRDRGDPLAARTASRRRHRHLCHHWCDRAPHQYRRGNPGQGCRRSLSW